MRIVIAKDCDIIFVSLEPWDDIWRRNQFLCAELARRHPDMKLLFVEPAQDLSHAVRRRQWQSLRTPAPWQVPGMENITVARPTKPLPSSWTVGRAINAALFRRHVRRMARQLGMHRPLLWLNPHTAVHMVGRMDEAATVYDITDDWILAAENQHERRRIAQQDRRLCELADLVVVCSQSLLDSRRSLARRSLLLPNGVDAAHYQPARQRVPADQRRWPAPVFGYTGTLHPGRVDTGLIEAVAQAFPQGSVVLIGPDHLSEAVRAQLDRYPNIHRLGPVPYQRLPELMAHLDVCIVPHVETPFTNSLNPIKLWEYLAVGRPIVASDVAGFRDYPHLCRIASGPTAFAEACLAASNEDDTLPKQRWAMAAEHSWHARVNDLEVELNRLRPQHPGPERKRVAQPAAEAG